MSLKVTWLLGGLNFVLTILRAANGRIYINKNIINFLLGLYEVSNTFPVTVFPFNVMLLQTTGGNNIRR